MTSNTPLEPVAGRRINLTRQRMIGIAAVVTIVAVLGLVLYLARNNAANADVGDCVKQAGATRLEQVDCGSPEARYKVVGRVDDKNQSEATFSTCGAFKGTTDIYWEESGGGSFVLCLAAVSTTDQ